MIDITITPAQAAAVNTALQTLENFVSTLPTFSATDKARMAKPKQGASDWMNYMLSLAAGNASKLAADFAEDSIKRDLNAEGTLAPFAVRTAAVWKRLNDAIFGAESDAWAACLNVRQTLMARGITDPNDPDLSKGLGDYFERHSTAAAKKTSGPGS